MLLQATPSLTRRNHQPGPAERHCSPAELELLALTLIATWSARTGRLLRDVPIDELSVDELEEFWTDDRLEHPYADSTHRRSW